MRTGTFESEALTQRSLGAHSALTRLVSRTHTDHVVVSHECHRREVVSRAAIADLRRGELTSRHRITKVHVNVNVNVNADALRVDPEGLS